MKMPLAIEATTAFDQEQYVVALHCSAGSPKQWRALAEEFGSTVELVVETNMSGSKMRSWAGDRAYCLADEAAKTIKLITGIDTPVHLVGHSFGGAVALNIAATIPERIASLSLYEPAAFHLLNQGGAGERRAFVEIDALYTAVKDNVLRGNFHGAAA